MTVEVNISLTLDGTIHSLSFDKAKELYDELGKVFEKNEKVQLHYPPGVRSFPDVALNDSAPKTLNVKADGVEDVADDITLPVISDVVVQKTEVQDGLVSEIRGLENDVEKQLEELKRQSRDISKNIENFQRK